MVLLWNYVYYYELGMNLFFGLGLRGYMFSEVELYDVWVKS